jgi:hypothetical protein
VIERFATGVPTTIEGVEVAVGVAVFVAVDVGVGVADESGVGVRVEVEIRVGVAVGTAVAEAVSDAVGVRQTHDDPAISRERPISRRPDPYPLGFAMVASFLDAPARIAVLTCERVRFGYVERRIAAAPATCGDAIEVPDMERY